MEKKEQYLTPREVSDMLHVKIGTLSKWRWAGIGPKYVKFGFKVLYRLSDIEEFIKQNIRTSTSNLCS